VFGASCEIENENDSNYMNILQIYFLMLLPKVEKIFMKLHYIVLATAILSVPAMVLAEGANTALPCRKKQLINGHARNSSA
jgi:hypothetical protein